MEGHGEVGVVVVEGGEKRKEESENHSKRFRVASSRPVELVILLILSRVRGGARSVRWKKSQGVEHWGRIRYYPKFSRDRKCRR